MEKPKIVRVLEQMSESLQAAEHAGQAAYTRQLAAMAPEDSEFFKRALLAVDMWGGAGAVWEVLPFPSRDAEKHFKRLVVRLADEMHALGIRDPRVEEIATILRYWLDVDVWSRIESPGHARPTEHKAPSDYIKDYLARRHIRSNLGR